MTREPVLFRVDGTRQRGWEGLARCLGFAYALQRRRRPCHFLARLEPTTLAALVRKGGNEWIEADGPAGTADDLEELTQEIRRIRPAAVVVDAPGCGPEYLSELVSLGPLVVAIDTDAAYRFPTQLVLNPLLGIPAADYEVCPGTQVLAGRRYALVRPEIRRTRPIRAQEPPEPLRALVAFGDDRQNQTARVVERLLSLPRLSHIDIIARPMHPLLEQWQSLAERHSDRVSVATEVAEVAARVSRCHFAFAEANSWSLEFACVGVPMILIVQEETYWQTAQQLEEEGAAHCLGWYADVSDGAIRTAAQNLMTERIERRAMARCGRALIDGRGPDRLITALEVMLHPSRQIDLSEAA